MVRVLIVKRRSASSRPLRGALLCLLVLAACSRGPSESELRKQVEEKLTRDLKPGLFEIVALRRTGSAPLAAAADGSKRLIVYFNGTLRFADNYSFGSWEELSRANLAYVLGATEKGISGVTDENRAGDLVYVYGSSTYQMSDGKWVPTASAASRVSATPVTDNTAPPSRSKQLIDKLAAMVEIAPPGVPAKDDDVISEELDKATENIQRRLERRQHVFVIATGPANGEYARFGTGVVESVKRLRGAGIAISSLATQGSVENAWLLARGEVDYAVMQSDVAGAAIAGEGPFARGGPIGSLRAVSSLFPEPIQLVASSRSQIREVADLRDRRVALGAPDSGTRFDALAVLEAAGVRADELGAASEIGLEEAAQSLANGQLDALFVTGMAPVSAIRELASRQQARVVPLSSAVIERLLERNPALVRLTLPPNTYPGQAEAIPTAAAAALLVTTTEAPDSEVENVLKMLFGKLDLQAAGSVEGSKISRKTALLGIRIPMHGGASHFFGSNLEETSTPK
ncbi:MAG: TAXI family TRAP transporter solute-binding subunit [Myxococcota bacterium]